MGKMKKKYEVGEASIYMTRKQALRKLQLSLKMFRRLCIIKGIYPREPKNRKKAQRGSTDKKTLYLKKDIQFLLHEPIMWKLRDHKVYMKRKNRAIALKDHEGLKRVIANKPTYSLDHIVKERYPTFIDAIRDLDDCLTLSFLFSTFPSMRFVPGALSRLCRRLTVEFLHYLIATKALRKVFVSIKGYYYQAEVKGQTITWIVPHSFGFQPQTPDEVDFRIMATFVEFYTTVLGFVNFRLFHAANICYPPKLVSPAGAKDRENLSEEDLLSERVAALNQQVLQITDETSSAADEVGVDDFSDAGNIEMRKEIETINKLKTLFQGFKFYLNREVPRESLTFVIRSFGGEVSWDGELYPGSTFDEADESITHQIIDRDVGNSGGKQYLSRYYIVPQWVFDSVNSRSLLPVENYFQGAILPPHVSPFATEREGDYVPIEKKQLLDMEKGLQIASKLPENQEPTDYASLRQMEDSDDEEGGSEVIKMSVKPGKPEVIDELKQREEESKEEYRLRVMMIKNKHKKLYRKMMDSRHRRKKEADKLVRKRQERSIESTTNDMDEDDE